MSEAIYLFGTMILMYMAWRLGNHAKTDLLETMREEVTEANRVLRQAEKHAESLLVVNKGLSREMQGMSKVISDHERYIDLPWIYAGTEVRSLGSVRYKDKAYLVMEPSGKGFTPFVVSVDNPKLQPRVVI
jgi:hypothetical protein